MASHDFSEFDGVELQPPPTPPSHAWSDFPDTPRENPSEIVIRNFFKGQHRELEEAFESSPAPVKSEYAWWSMSTGETKTVLVELYGKQWKLTQTKHTKTARYLVLPPSGGFMPRVAQHADVKVEYAMALAMAPSPTISKVVLSGVNKFKVVGGDYSMSVATPRWSSMKQLLDGVWDNDVVLEVSTHRLFSVRNGIIVFDDYDYADQFKLMWYDFGVRHRPGKSPKNPRKRVFDGSDYLTKERPAAKKPSGVLSGLLKRSC